MNQRLYLAVVAILSSLSLAACTSLPTSSSPSPFDVDAPNAQPVDLAAGGPVADADPESLLSSFLLACAAELRRLRNRTSFLNQLLRTDLGPA